MIDGNSYGNEKVRDFPKKDRPDISIYPHLAVKKTGSM
jgi:hypothetical protein